MKSNQKLYSGRDNLKRLNDRPGDYQELPPSSRQAKAAVANDNTATNPLIVTANYEQPDPVGRRQAPAWFRDVVSLLIFIVVILIGAWLINHFVFQSFNVLGPSMEPTLEGEGGISDRLIVNRMPVTAASLSGKQYTPERGDIIVFKNPLHADANTGDEYIVKRVIGLPGERVTVNDCRLLVYNDQHPDGFDPYPTFTNLAENDAEINTCVEGDGTDVTVPTGQLFVVGDHRIGNYSMDSRNGGGRASLGTIPLEDVVGPVAVRIWPLNKITVF